MYSNKYYIKKSVLTALAKRADGKCEICGKAKLVEVHHIKPWREGGKNTIDNLKLICHDCHSNLKVTPWDIPKPFKTLHESFTDQEFEDLQTLKGKQTWHDFILRKEPTSNIQQLQRILKYLVRWIGYVKLAGATDVEVQPVLAIANSLKAYLDGVKGE